MYHLQCTSLRFNLYQVNNDSGHAFMVIGEENIVMTCYATRDHRLPLHLHYCHGKQFCYWGDEKGSVIWIRLYESRPIFEKHGTAMASSVSPWRISIYLSTCYW